MATRGHSVSPGAMWHCLGTFVAVTTQVTGDTLSHHGPSQRMTQPPWPQGRGGETSLYRPEVEGWMVTCFGHAESQAE